MENGEYHGLPSCNTVSGMKLVSGISHGFQHKQNRLIPYFILMCHVFFSSHTSKFNQRVRNEQQVNKNDSKTMGPAKVKTNAPCEFLKKREKEPQLPKKESKNLCMTFLDYRNFFSGANL